MKLRLWFSLLGLLGSAVAATALPTITQQPASVTIASGQPATFEVAATGIGTVSYQWRRLGHPIVGAITNSLIIPAVEQASGGFYDVAIHDNAGTTVSSPALLTVASAVTGGSYRLDPSFAPLVTVTSSTYARPEVRSIDSLANGTVYVAGRFAMIAGGRRSGLARFSSSLVLDPVFGPEILGEVNVVLVQPDGRVLIGGDFTHVVGVARKNLARLNSDGSLDASFDPGTGCDAPIHALVRQSDGRILIGGAFTSYGGATANRIVRVLSDGAMDPSFQTGTGCDGTVTSLALQTDGKPVIVGSFGAVNGVTRAGLARFLADGRVDNGFAPSGTYGARSVAVQTDGKVLVAGQSPSPALARFNADGSPDGTFSLDSAIDYQANAIRIAPDGGIYLVGWFGNQQGSIRRYVARLLPSGGLDTNFAPQDYPAEPAECLCLQTDGRLLVGGVQALGGHFLPDGYELIGATATGGFARYTATGAVDAIVAGGIGIPGTVNDVVPASGGKWYIAGEFNHVNGVPRNRIARLNFDGSLDPTFNPGGGFSRATHRIAVAGDGKVLVGGSFTSFDGHDREGVVRLDPTGSLDESFASYSWSSVNTGIGRIRIQNSGKILVGGHFSQFAGVDRGGLVRLNSDGSSDGAFNAGFGFGGDVNDIALQLDGRILVGGSFYSTSFAPSCSYLIRLQSEGGLDPSFSANGGTDSSVFSVQVRADGRALLGGRFTSVNGLRRNRIARLQADGALDTAFDPGTGFDDEVDGLFDQADGHVIVAGVFTSFNGVPRKQYSRLTASGALDPSFTVYDYTSYVPAEAKETGDGRLLLAGTKAIRGGHAQYGLAMFKQDVSPVPAIVVSPVSQVAQPGGTVAFSVTATGDDLLYQWSKDGIAIVGATKASLTLQDVQTTSLGRFAVTVSNSLGSVTSAPVEIVGPSPAPVINLAPASHTVVSGTPVSLTVSATGSGSLAYQWRRLGVPIDGATTNTLSFGAAEMADVGFYDVVVCAGLSRAISQPVQLRVVAANVASLYRMDPTFTPCFANAKSSSVTRVAVAADRSLVIGGGFSVFMGQPRDNLARVTASMELDAAFHPAVNGGVSSVVIQADGKILISGGFTSIDGIERRGVARLNADGSIDPSFDLGSFSELNDGLISEVIVQPDGRILVGIYLDRPIDASRSGVYRFSATGTPDPTFSYSPSYASVSALALAPGGGIYVAGDRLPWSAQPERADLLRLNSDGSVDLAFTPIVNGGRSVSSLVVQGDGRVLVGGCTTSISSPVNVWRYLPNGTLDPTFAPSGESAWSSVSLLLQSDGRILVGRYLQSIAKGEVFLSRINVDGTPDSTFSLPAGLDNSVRGLVSHPDGGVVACGDFLRLGSEGLAGVAHFSDSGALIGAVAGYHGTDGTVSRVLSLPGDKWLVVGSFTHVGTVPHGDIAVIRDDGSVDNSFDPGSGFSWRGGGACDGLARDGAGRILVAGNFTAYQGQSCPKLVRLLPNGANDDAFVAAGVTRFVGGVTLGPQGQIYVVAEGGILRLNEFGANDSTFHTAAAMYPTEKFAVQADGRVVYSNASDGASGPKYVGRLNTDGSLDSTFDRGTGDSRSGVRFLLLQPDGGCLVGGSFGSFDGKYSNGMVHLGSNGGVDRSLTYFPRVPAPQINQILPLADSRLLLRGKLNRFWTGRLHNSELYRLENDWSLFPVEVFDVESGGEVFPMDDGRLMVAGTSGQRGASRAYGLVILRPEAVSPAPVVIQQPEGLVLVEGQSAAFSVGATGEGALSYEWRKYWGGLASATDATYTIPAAKLSDSGTYEVVVRSDFGEIRSRQVTLSVSEFPLIATHPASQNVVESGSATLSVTPLGSTAGFTYQWFRNGVEIAGASGTELRLTNVQSAQAGIYVAEIRFGAKTTRSRPAVVGVLPPAGAQTAGAIVTRPEWQSIHHSNGNVYDQFLLTGASGTITAAAGKIARVSLLDALDNIVQFEMSGPGALTIVLANPSGPKTPALYIQPGIEYMQGTPTLVLSGAEESTHMSIYSVGRLTNPGVTRSDVTYDGWANVGAACVQSITGGLGGLYYGNVLFASTAGPAGIVAPSVWTVGTLNFHDLVTTGSGQPMILLAPEGQANIKITGGSLAQPGGSPIAVAGLDTVQMVAGQGSSGQVAPAQANQGRLVFEGIDLTDDLIVGP
ncbi:MAG: hypothetical protein IPL39_15380 [Opitutaceae bacterium]|nr:hypothetical protein [Opitutaceae bacterium]